MRSFFKKEKSLSNKIMLEERDMFFFDMNFWLHEFMHAKL